MQNLRYYSSRGSNLKKYAFSLITIITLLFATEAIAQTPDWLWAKGPGKFNGRFVNRIAVDSKSNIIQTGSFYGSFIIIGKDTLQNHGLEDFFNMKYDSNGNVLWYKTLG